VRLALIGFGYWGPNYARVLSDLPGAELTAVCDQRPDRLEVVRQRYRAVAACDSLDQLFARDDVDAVVIRDAGGDARGAGRASLDSGRHVLVEKPMSLVPEGCVELCDRADAAGRC
jgi:predicted dehydrogenase